MPRRGRPGKGLSPEVAPYGTWASPVSAELVVRAGTGVSSPLVSGEAVYWLESRPSERGRVVVVKRGPNRRTADVTPPGWSVRTRVHEYGGGAYLVWDDTVVFSNWADQRLWRQDGGGEPLALTGEPGDQMSVRYADGQMIAGGEQIVCVRETHRENAHRPQVVNELVLVDTDGGGGETIVSTGRDFYASPRPNPVGPMLAWISWDHPNMPWDATELWLAPLGAAGLEAEPRRVAGGAGESILQPLWGSDGELWYVSDRTGWWNLYRLEARDVRTGAAGENVLPMEAEFAGPLWSLGQSWAAPMAGGRLMCSWRSSGADQLGTLDPSTGKLQPIELPYTTIESVAGSGSRAVILASSATSNRCVVAVDIDGGGPEGPHSKITVVREPEDPGLDEGSISLAVPIEFRSGGQDTADQSRDGAHALFYRPSNARYIGPDDRLPPLLVSCHGGPTGAARSGLSLALQYWTTRGFAVVDVDYGGSTGYGRAYRERLAGRWGRVDVEDCIAAAAHLVSAGEVDIARLAVRGASSGGFTALSVLASTDIFAAGAIHYGVADLEALARETHKFESHYTERLVGPYPEARQTYIDRSPVRRAGRISCPVILFQGLEDEVVPPAQAEAMVDSLRRRGVRVVYVAFEGEQHGFRMAETIVRTLEAELGFYGEVMGFEPSDELPPTRFETPLTQDPAGG